MASFFDHLFDSNYRQREDISLLQSEVSTLDKTHEIRELRLQIAQLRLLTSALASVIEQKGIATREELALTVQQIDLLDGIEDGIQGSIAVRSAPRCASCSHFVNPNRDHCIYCGAAMDNPILSRERTGPPSTSKCASCDELTPQSEMFFTERGLCCARCEARDR